MFDHPDFIERYKNKWYGKYRGIVASIDDPEKMGRIKVKVPTVFGIDADSGETAISGWAWPSSPASGSNAGFTSLPSVDQVVWVEFEEGDVEKPVWSHGPWTMLGGENNVPRHARRRYDASDNHERNTPEIPPSQFDGQYGKVNSWQSPGGHKIELDDTSGKERLLIEHKSGARIEILQDGTVHQVSPGNKREVVGGTDRKVTNGQVYREVAGPSNFKYRKKRVVEDNSDLEHIVIGGVTYSYRSKEENVTGTNYEASGSKVIKVQSNSEETVGGSKSVGVLGSYDNLIMETAQWIVANSTGVNPLANPILFHMAHPAGMGSIKLKAGFTSADESALEIRGLASAAAAIEAPLANVVLKAVALMALKAPLITMGPTGVVAPPVVEPVARATSLILWLQSHVHIGNNGAPTSIPLAPVPVTAISRSVLVE